MEKGGKADKLESRLRALTVAAVPTSEAMVVHLAVAAGRTVAASARIAAKVFMAKNRTRVRLRHAAIQAQSTSNSAHI
jgi:hypothetical protein